MPRKKGKSLKTKKIENVLSTSKSYMSLAYGVITVIILFVIMFLTIKTISHRNGAITQTAEKTEIQVQTLGRTYEVKEGDTLWAISENLYKDGFKWTELAKANKISNPSSIEKGMKLAIPVPKNETPTPTPAQEVQTGGKIMGSSYTVHEGDNLWDISVRAYGDGFKWTEIAQKNNLSTPDLIFSGNVLQLPR